MHIVQLLGFLVGTTLINIAIFGYFSLVFIAVNPAIAFALNLLFSNIPTKKPRP
jgi:hypothetical protein